MSQTAIKTNLSGFIGELVFSNPKKHNALSQISWAAIPEALKKLVDGGARTIVISGSGNSFCAGADISEFDVVRKNADTARIYEKSNTDAFDAIRQTTVPTIAKIKGNCIGGGFGIAAACDLRIASEEARFSVPAAKLGLGYPVSAMADITAGVGQQNAKRMLFTAEVFTAKQMYQMGFLLTHCDPKHLDDETNQIASKISILAPLTHRATKAASLSNGCGSLEDATRISDETFESADYEEGRRAFKEKRPPSFTGR